MLTPAIRSLVVRDWALLVVGVAGGVLVGAAYAFRQSYGIALLGVVVLVIVVAVRPVLLAVAALLGVFLVQRFGAGGTASNGVSYSDILLAVASVFAIPSLLREADLLRRVRTPLIGLAVYLACLLPTVFQNPSQRAYLEWTHRAVLVGGAVIVGAWLVRDGVVRPALRLLVAISCVVGAASVVYTLRHGFDPAYPFGLNKNLVGALLGAVAIVVLVAHDSLGLRRNVQVVAVVLVLSGLMASQSRGGLLGTAAALLVAFVASSGTHSRRARLLSGLIALAFAVVVIVSVRSEFERTKAADNNTSIGTRINVERTTFDIFQTSELTGVGLKYFDSGSYGMYAQASNNALNNELAESGLVGLAGFVVMQVLFFGRCVRVRREAPLAIAALGVLSGSLLHGMVDIYWSAGSASLPFVIVGIGLASARDARPDAAPGPPSRRPATAAR